MNLIILLKAILKAFSIANNSASNTSIFDPRFHERLFELFVLKLIVQNTPASKLLIFSFFKLFKYAIILLTF